jgi:hypothetical protein
LSLFVSDHREHHAGRVRERQHLLHKREGRRHHRHLARLRLPHHGAVHVDDPENQEAPPVGRFVRDANARVPVRQPDAAPHDQLGGVRAVLGTGVELRLHRHQERQLDAVLAQGLEATSRESSPLNERLFQQSKIEFEDRISRDSVLVLKAAQEGARRVLIVGTRNAPVCVRDAMSGLHLRTMNEIVSPTVYTLLLENSMVYCGTTFHDILVFRFHVSESLSGGSVVISLNRTGA